MVYIVLLLFAGVSLQAMELTTTNQTQGVQEKKQKQLKHLSDTERSTVVASAQSIDELIKIRHQLRRSNGIVENVTSRFHLDPHNNTQNTYLTFFSLKTIGFPHATKQPNTEAVALFDAWKQDDASIASKFKIRHTTDHEKFIFSIAFRIQSPALMNQYKKFDSNSIQSLDFTNLFAHNEQCPLRMQLLLFYLISSVESTKLKCKHSIFSESDSCFSGEIQWTPKKCNFNYILYFSRMCETINPDFSLKQEMEKLKKQFNGMREVDKEKNKE